MLGVGSFFCNDTAATELYTYWHTLSLRDALPIYRPRGRAVPRRGGEGRRLDRGTKGKLNGDQRRRRNPRTFERAAPYRGRRRVPQPGAPVEQIGRAHV